MEEGLNVVTVRLTDGDEASGLGAMVAQYLDQDMRDSPRKRSLAARLRGTVTMEAIDKGVAVTVMFTGQDITITNGAAAEPDLYVGGRFSLLMDVVRGVAPPVLAACRRRLRLRHRLGRPLFPWQVYRLFRLERGPA